MMFVNCKSNNGVLGGTKIRSTVTLVFILIPVLVLNLIEICHTTSVDTNSKGEENSNSTVKNEESSTNSNKSSAGHWEEFLQFSNLKKQSETYEQDENVRPPYTYSRLICQALLNEPNNKMTFDQIFNFIAQKYAYYKREIAICDLKKNLNEVIVKDVNEVEMLINQNAATNWLSIVCESESSSNRKREASIWRHILLNTLTQKAHVTYFERVEKKDEDLGAVGHRGCYWTFKPGLKSSLYMEAYKAGRSKIKL